MPNPISKLLSLGDGKRLRQYRQMVDKINALEDGLAALPESELRAIADRLRERACAGEENERLLPESFALMREASKRTVGLRHYDVQLIGGMALNDGCVAEMKTGEGKTLVSTAAGFLNALSGEPVHVVTVNDYLAKRDAEWVGRIYGLLGMEVGLIQNGMESYERKPSYGAAVTYGTNSEFGFDYLRDNMVSSPRARVQRGHAFAVVDEADSVLIDEARTPLIISGLSGAPSEICNSFAEIAARLNPETDVVLDEKRRTVYETEAGLAKIEKLFGSEVYADLSGATANRLRQALKAQFLFKLDHDYVVDGGEVKIVDGFTGRIMEGRRYSEGLHQAIEAKEHVRIKPETHTIATVTLQNYFRLYKKLSGMTGTALTADSELSGIYHMPVVPIPTNKPVIREDKGDLIFRTAEAKFAAVADEVERRHAKGQPVLVGTASVKASERLSAKLTERGIGHQVLNAKEHEREAAIVAEAGRLGAVTVATNMAGRGTDILLGGNYEMLRQAALRKFGVKDEESAAEWQLHSADAEARYITDREGYAVRVLGGLCVIGTERHEARRIDNQLRGRAGRQGDPGESRFYLSLEDDLLRLFGKERIHKVSEMMVQKGIPDDSPLEDPLVSKVITTAQQQVESMHFASRKNVLEYDDVMDLQRKAIYGERNAILDGKDVCKGMGEFVESLVDALLGENCPAEIPSDDWDFETVNAWVESMTGEEGYDAGAVECDQDSDVLAEEVRNHLMGVFGEKREAVGDPLFGELCTQITLRIMDTHWVAHLTDMEGLKAGIGLRAYGHRDPLVEYKEEAYQAFSRLVDSIYEDSLRAILRLPVEGAGVVSSGLSDEDNPFRPEDMVYSDSRSAPEVSTLNEPDPAGGNPLG
mgnify:FL=1